MNKPKNLSASVHQRLLNNAKETNRPFNEVLQYFAMERFLYRLSMSKLADTFVLKGALLFRAWDTPERRPTMDIDFLGFTDNAPKNISKAIKQICSADVEPDGIEFESNSIVSVKIKEDADYEGVRSRFMGRLGNAKISMQIDIGFGDIIHPSAQKLQYPTILAFPSAELRSYTLESVVAEKVEAMVHLGRLNSRMKDFYDVWLCARQYNFDGISLVTAIEQTFSNRGTELVEYSEIHKEIHKNNNLNAQWHGFIKKSNLLELSGFELLEPTLDKFLNIPLNSAINKKIFDHHWKAPGPWTNG